jgi:hypothetical protein
MRQNFEKKCDIIWRTHNVRTIYEVVEPKSTKRVNQFNMGFVRSQATQSSCAVTNLTAG